LKMTARFITVMILPHSCHVTDQWWGTSSANSEL